MTLCARRGEPPDKLVRIVYIDEAGLSKASEEPYLVVAGVIVHADQALAQAQTHFNALTARLIPFKNQDRFVFHAAEIFNGGGIFDRKEWPLEKRLTIAKELAEIPGKFDLSVALGYVERSAVPDGLTLPTGKKLDRTAAQFVLSFIACMIQVERWMRANAKDEVWMLVVEDNPTFRNVVKEAHAYYTRPDIVLHLPYALRQFFPLVQIKEDPLFQANRSSSLLQMADFCAYLWKRRLMNPYDQRFAPYWSAWSDQMVAFS